MSTKQDLIRSIKSTNKGSEYLNVGGVAKARGRHRNSKCVKDFIKKLPIAEEAGNEKRFLVQDVAEEIWKERQRLNKCY